ncbi:Hypothetical predicted protein, partial [Mytilus galloprovincialis]
MDYSYQLSRPICSHYMHTSACSCHVKPWQPHREFQKLKSLENVNTSKSKEHKQSRNRRHKSKAQRLRDMKRLFQYRQQREFRNELPFSSITNIDLDKSVPKFDTETEKINKLKRGNKDLKKTILVLTPANENITGSILDTNSNSDNQKLELERLSNELKYHKDIVDECRVCVFDMEKYTSSLMDENRKLKQNQENLSSLGHSSYQTQQLQNDLQSVTAELNKAIRDTNFWKDNAFRENKQCSDKYTEVRELEQEIKQLKSDKCGLTNELATWKTIIRSDIRNPWAHCDFTEWTATKYADSFQLMGQLITNLRLSNREENRILGELNRWETN